MEAVSMEPTWLLTVLLLALASIGFARTVRSFLTLLWFFYAYFLRPAKDLRSLGSWAVVTGPTDGIGRAMAFELSRKGLHLVLVGRSPAKLQDVSAALRRACPSSRVVTVLADFSGDSADVTRRLALAVEGLDVGVLVNSAGMSYAKATYFHEDDAEAWREVVKVNLVALTEVTRVVLPGMVARGKGAVVNVGSAASVVVPAFPLYSVYAATKAYVDQFSRSLAVEYRNSGINIQCQIPLYVDTKMVTYKLSSLSRNPFFMASPSAYARAAVRWIGYESRCSPYWPHFLVWCFVSLIPDSIHHAVRLRIHKSQQRSQEKILLKKGR